MDITMAAGLYCVLTYLCVYFVSDLITIVGSQFEGMGIAGIPMALAYG